MKRLTLKAAAQNLVARQKFTQTSSFPGNKGDDGTGVNGYQFGYGEVKQGKELSKGGAQPSGGTPVQSNKGGMSAAAPVKTFRFPQNPTTPGKIVSHVSGNMTEAAKALLARRAA